MSIDDETLMAYVDDELDPARAAEIQALAEEDAEVARRVAEFRDSAASLRTAFHGQDALPVPEHLQAMLQPPTVSSAPAWLDLLRGLLTRPPALAFAALATLAVGAVLGHLASGVSGSSPVSAGLIASYQGSAWNAGFESTPSGQGFDIPMAGEVATIRPLLTFLDAQDRPCRGFAHAPDAAGSRRGVACRTEGGKWQTQVVLVEAVTPEALTSAGVYRPASGGESAFDRVLQLHMTTSPFEPEEERALMRRAWDVTH